MSDVYLAEDERTSETIALKVLPREMALRPDRVERFQREARAVASLDHPAIVRVFDTGSTDGVHYIAMERVSGASLAEIIRRGAARGLRAFAELVSDEPAAPLPAERLREAKAAYFHDVARTLAPIASAVHLAHKRGIIHRDIKPSNVLVDREGNPHLTDFGIARIDGTTALTSPGEVIGTADYVSPEQTHASDDRVMAPSDVFSLGATLFECLTRQPPFGSGAPEVVIQRIRETEPPNPRSIDPEIPEPLARIALRCLEKAPDRRYGSAADLADDLARFAAGQPVRAKAIPSATRAWRRVRERGEPLAALGGALALAIVCGSIIGWARWNESESRRHRAEDVRASGIALYGLGRIDDARERFDRAIEIDPDNSLSFAFRALPAIAARRESEARTYLQQAADRGLAPEIVDAIRDGSDPFPELEPSGKVDSDKALIEFLCGLGCERRLDHRRAHDRFRKAVRFDANLLGAYLQDAAALEQLGETSEAIAAIHRHRDRVAPESPEAQLGMGLELHLRGEWVRAIKEFDRVAESEMTPEVTYSRGRARLELCSRGLGAVDEPSKAVRDFRLVLEFDPSNGSAQVGLAGALFLQSVLAENRTPNPEVEALIDAVLANHPDDPDALRMKASIAIVAGEFAPAIGLLDRVSERLPRDPGSLRSLAFAHVGLSEDAKAKGDTETHRRELLEAATACERLLEALPLAAEACPARDAQFEEIVVEVQRWMNQGGLHDDAIRLLKRARRHFSTGPVAFELGIDIYNRFADGKYLSTEDRDESAKVFDEEWSRGNRSLVVSSTLLYLYAEHHAAGATRERIGELVEETRHFDVSGGEPPSLVVNLAVGLALSGVENAARDALARLKQAGLDDPDTAPADLRDDIRKVIEAAKGER